MKAFTRIVLLILTLVACSFGQMGLTPDEQKKVETAFKTANELLQKDKPREALKYYNDALAILPKDPAILYNAGMASYLAEEYDAAAELWKRLKVIEPDDWQTRAKLIQAYHALKRDAEITTERDELFDLRKSGKSADLAGEESYCREQFKVGDQYVLALEHFELKGNRALRYVFIVSKSRTEPKEDFRISLGSYDITNAIWRETTKPTPPPGDRLFHLDGYYDWGHSTLGMFPKEPTYKETREMVMKVLEGKAKPLSSSQKVQ